jgi:NitT/TauT family transport system permease protein
MLQTFCDFFRADAKLRWWSKLLLAAIPFVFCIMMYADKSAERRAENPKDRTMPSLVQVGQGFQRAVTAEDRQGRNVLLRDVGASGIRVAISIAIIMTGLFIGLGMGVFPFIDAFLYPFVIVSKFFIPATLISVLFATVGAGEEAKIILMVLSLFPLLILEARKCSLALPREQLDKTWSLGATDLEYAFRVVLPQIWPHLKDFLRLNLHVVITLLIVAEGFGASEGLGYRILVNQRNINMADVIPYVVIIAGFLWMADKTLVFWIRRHKWLTA